jgi:hypothetical protein
VKSYLFKLIFSVSIFLNVPLCHAQAEWPESITAADGTVINTYQPQGESFSGNTLKSRTAQYDHQWDAHMHVRFNNKVYSSKQGDIPGERNNARGFTGNNGLRGTNDFRSLGGNKIFSDRVGNIYRRGEQGK